MRGTKHLTGAALAAMLTTASASAQPASGMIAPLWRGVTHVTIDFAFTGNGEALDGALRGAAADAARGKSAWSLADGPIPADRGIAILTLHYDGAALHGSVRRALEIDDAESARVTQPIMLAANADRATIDRTVADVIATALPQTRAPGRRIPEIHREY